MALVWHEKASRTAFLNNILHVYKTYFWVNNLIKPKIFSPHQWNIYSCFYIPSCTETCRINIYFWKKSFKKCSNIDKILGSKFLGLKIKNKKIYLLTLKLPHLFIVSTRVETMKEGNESIKFHGKTRVIIFIS